LLCGGRAGRQGPLVTPSTVTYGFEFTERKGKIKGNIKEMRKGI